MHAEGIGKDRRVSAFMELFLSLTESGFPLVGALKVLSQKKETKQFARAVLEKLEQSGSISQALCTTARRLSKYETLLMTAEETGDIVPSLREITEELKERDEAKRNLTAAAVYPVFVCLLAAAFSIVLIVWGIPYINLIAGVNKEDMVKTVAAANLWLILSLSMVFFLTGLFTHRYDFAFMLFRNLYYLNKSSVGMEDSLLVLMKDSAFKGKNLRCIAAILQGLRGGEKLWRICERIRGLDAFTIAWLYITEENGEVGQGFKKIYENYSAKRKSAAETAGRFMEPCLLGISGVYILILISGCVIPVFMSLGVKIL